ncbi:MAG: ATP-dependent DNA helicase RecG, partial [Deltaproteobacteria bacterium]|nr:ATP-dependent DNA helicase RecG [Deltaproteobacteria bacterium]
EKIQIAPCELTLYLLTFNARHSYYNTIRIVMKQFEDILERIENPLQFLSKHSFKNLSVVKNVESTMEGLIAALKAILQEDSACGDSDVLIGELYALFVRFDELHEEEKKKHITTALHLISILREVNSRTAKESRDGDARIQDLDECFETLSRPVQYIKGIGPKIAALLEKRGIVNLEDLLYCVPRRYEDRRNISSIAAAAVGSRETVIGEVIQSTERRYARRKIFEATIRDSTGTFTAKWFHGSFLYLKKEFVKGRRCFMTGEMRGQLFGKEMIHPDYEFIDDRGEDDEFMHMKRIIPVYPEMEGIHKRRFRTIMNHAVNEYSHHVPSPIPSAICRRNHFISMADALQRIHFPGEDENMELYNQHASASHKRIVFDEFFFFELGMGMKKKGYALEKGIAFDTRHTFLLDTFYSRLPFSLTGAQARVIKEIMEDMNKPYPMNRLLQGDVGSGKTVVSMAAMLIAAENGYQSVIMAPTEILAAQHYSNIKSWAEETGVKAELLTGSIQSKKHKELYDNAAGGNVDIIAGTHALIQEGLKFRKLGLVIIDEQHRFGVAQRALLREKGFIPDVLVMTATPIPRTLAMTVYGDLDISVIDEMPPGKNPIKTKVFLERDRHRVYEIIRREIGKGNQTFVVYPLVEESESLDLKDATKMSQHLQNDIFPDYTVGLIHGKMKSHEKDVIMHDFITKKIHILVATTVIEVGIDIPGASLMIVEHAERFGLSQLHQLRGRVGRGDIQSYCILITHTLSSRDAKKRLKVMEETNDGFRISEEDLLIRGPGDFMGTRQSGIPDFRVANILRDGKILNDTRKEALCLLDDDPGLQKPEHRDLKRVLLRKWGERLELAKTG